MVMPFNEFKEQLDKSRERTLFGKSTTLGKAISAIESRYGIRFSYDTDKQVVEYAFYGKVPSREDITRLSLDARNLGYQTLVRRVYVKDTGVLLGNYHGTELMVNSKKRGLLKSGDQQFLSLCMPTLPGEYSPFSGRTILEYSTELDRNLEGIVNKAASMVGLQRTIGRTNGLYHIEDIMLKEESNSEDAKGLPKPFQQLLDELNI
jgi:hypothetical protein